MSALVLHLESALRYERIEDIASFVGEDASGSFGLLPGHAPMATVLESGLARFRTATGPWQYVAAPGAVLRLAADGLHYTAHRYLRGDNPDALREALRAAHAAQAQETHEIGRSVHRLEQEMMRRLWLLSRGAEPAA